jgi:hypothetical protein
MKSYAVKTRKRAGRGERERGGGAVVAQETQKNSGTWTKKTEGVGGHSPAPSPHAARHALSLCFGRWMGSRLKPRNGACHESPVRLLGREGAGAAEEVVAISQKNCPPCPGLLDDFAAPLVHYSSMHQPPLLRALLLVAAVGALGSARTHAITGSTWTLDTVKALVEDVDRAQYTRPLEYMGALQAALERVVGSGPVNAGTGSSVAQRAILNTGHGNDGGQLTRGSGAAPSNTGRVVVRLLQRLGDTALFLRRFEDALAYYRDAHTRVHDLAMTQSGPSSTSRELLASHAAIAKALRHAQQWVLATTLLG